MATIYQKTVSDKACILAPREFFLRPFDFGLWTEMRIGIYFDGVAASGDNTDSAIETATVNTAADRIAIGLKDSASNDLPGFGSALFLGAVTETGQDSYCGGSWFGISGVSRLSAAGYFATTLVGGAFAQTLTNGMDYPASSSGATGYNGFYVIKFVITNRGAATQSVAISSSATSPIAGTDYSAAALRLLMNGAVFNPSVATAWNTGAAARTIPDAVYVRMPFYSNRIRISAIRAIRYAP